MKYIILVVFVLISLYTLTRIQAIFATVDTLKTDIEKLELQNASFESKLNVLEIRIKEKPVISPKTNEGDFTPAIDSL